MDGYWIAEPDIPRTAKGIKNRVARLRALGNAVVPAQVYPIFRAIMYAEEEGGWNFMNCGR
jgi:DNA (cytosine-5)-methyltransferase 1